MQSICTITDLRNDTNRVVAWAKRSGRAVVITKDGSPECVLISPRTYERRLKALNLAKLIAVSEADFRAGRFKPAREVIRNLRRDYGL